jgi:folate-dependent phosphoribosylglycinamide formyltransferase PurN
VAAALLWRSVVPAFVIITTADLPEAYFLAAFLESRGQPFALVNIVARTLLSQLRVLARLRRNRGTRYLADLLLARAMDLLQARRPRPPGPRSTAFPEIQSSVIEALRRRHPCLDCRDPHASQVVDFIRTFGPDYMLLAGSPILRPGVFGLARKATLNRHLGLVPEFRGSDCTMWALALDRPECVGYSIHLVNERVDGGDVIVRRPLPLQGDRSLGDYLRRLQRQASTDFVEVLDELIDGLPIAPTTQQGKGQYYPPAGWSVRRQAQRTFARLVDQTLPGDTPLRPLSS